MASVLKIFLWSAFFGIIGFFIHYETSTVVLNYKEEILIKAKRADVYATLADVERSSKFQPFVVEVRNVDRRYNNKEIEEIAYTVVETIPVWNLYYTNITFPVIMQLTKPYEEATTDVVVYGGLMVIHVEYFFTDHGDKGFTLTEVAEMKAIQLFASLAEENFQYAHKQLLKNLKEFAESSYPTVQE